MTPATLTGDLTLGHVLAATGLDQSEVVILTLLNRVAADIAEAIQALSNEGPAD